MTLDESLDDDDEVIELDGVEVVIDRALHQSLGEVLIDFSPESGVVVQTLNPGEEACRQGCDHN